MIGIVCRCLTLSIVVLAVLIASFIAVLDLNPTLQRAWFAWFFPLLRSNDVEMDALRCQLLEPVHGRVLEIGFGTGGNLHCFNGTRAAERQISLFVGIEPNVDMEDAIAATLRKVKITFPFRVDAAHAEDLSAFKEASFDFVISTHVLCSVDDIDAVLGEVHRVLAPGGQFVFFEHTTAPAGSTSRSVQEWIARPWSAIAAGCKFVDIARALQRHASEWQLAIEPFSAPMPFAILQPHVRGTATKR
jgi:ubiquinone/menaquinone biosynthesis C-methylase UbiE